MTMLTRTGLISSQTTISQMRNIPQKTKRNPEIEEKTQKKREKLLKAKIPKLGLWNFKIFVFYNIDKSY